ncbi:hypothetical protein [Butyricimonas faecihominis]|jgi:hypothetical protein|uniref:hypothetical protein n=1 Tax=Butyricimonas faecihominis TaxID=1472416 RepID=UPI0032C0EE49
MDMNVFIDLYKRVGMIRVNSCPPSALSGLLHGYLSVCSIVRVYPWLEEEYGTWWDNYLRIQEIARELEKLVRDATLPYDERAGYVSDLLDAYQIYDDMPLVDLGLEVAYTLLATEGVKKLICLGGTSNICRLLCHCFYFANDEECKEVAGNIVRGWLEGGRENGKFSRKNWQAVLFYENVVNDNLDYYESGEREQLQVCNIKVEDELIKLCVSQVEELDVYSLVNVFHLLAERAFGNYDKIERSF